MLKRIAVFFVLFFALMGAASATTAPRYSRGGFYIDGNGGVQYTHVTLNLSGQTVETTKVHGFTWTGNVGYLFNPSLGLEVGFNQFDASVSSVRLVDAALKGIIPMGEVISLFGKAGLAMSVSTPSSSDNTPAVYLAVGGAWAISRHLDLDLQLTGITHDISTLGAFMGGLVYYFG